MKRFFFGVVVLLLTCFVAFYFWASSGFNEEENYDQIVTYRSKGENPADTFSVLTYNVGYFSGMTNNLSVDRKESLFSENFLRLKNILLANEFDFVGLQEVDFGSARSFGHNQFDSLGIGLGFYQGAYAVNWDKSYLPFPYWPIRNQFGSIYSGQGILSKVQLLSNDLVVLDKPLDAPFFYKAFYLDRILQISKMQLGSDTLVLMNVHLEAFDKLTRELQAEKVLLEFKKWSDDYPVILLGDFNSRPPFASAVNDPEKTIKIFLEDPEVREAISKERYLANETAFFTFDTAEPYERLDYIFYNKSKIKKIDSDVLRIAKDISDHLPVWMTFTLIE